MEQGVTEGHVAKFYIRPRLIRSVLRTFSVFKMAKIVILWINYTIFFSFSSTYPITAILTSVQQKQLSYENIPIQASG